MFLKGKDAVIADEGFEGRLDIRKMKGMLRDDEKLLMVIPIETRGKGDYDMVAGLTYRRILICDADTKHQESLVGNLETCGIEYWETPKGQSRIRIGTESYKVENKVLTKELVNKSKQLQKELLAAKKALKVDIVVEEVVVMSHLDKLEKEYITQEFITKFIVSNLKYLIKEYNHITDEALFKEECRSYISYGGFLEGEEKRFAKDLVDELLIGKYLKENEVDDFIVSVDKRIVQGLYDYMDRNY